MKLNGNYRVAIASALSFYIWKCSIDIKKIELRWTFYILYELRKIRAQIIGLENTVFYLCTRGVRSDDHGECRGPIDPTVDIESHIVVGVVDVAECRQR